MTRAGMCDKVHTSVRHDANAKKACVGAADIPLIII